MQVQIESSWAQRLQSEFDAPYFQQLTDFVRSEYRQTTCYPPGPEIFNAFNLCPFEQTKVVLIGQDPYHGPGPNRGGCCSTPPLPYAPIRQLRTKAKAGRSLPMP